MPVLTCVEQLSLQLCKPNQCLSMLLSLKGRPPVSCHVECQCFSRCQRQTERHQFKYLQAGFKSPNSDPTYHKLETKKLTILLSTNTRAWHAANICIVIIDNFVESLSKFGLPSEPTTPRNSCVIPNKLVNNQCPYHLHTILSDIC